jgi:hypothetical protein
MATIGRHDSKLSDCAPALPTPFDAMTVMALQGPEFPDYRPHVASMAKPAEPTTLPPRPDPGIISEAIPLFFIARNEDGLWVAREADGQIGGIFLRKQAALQFANRTSQPGGCATMFLSGRFELDVENIGNPLVAHLVAAKRLVLQLAQRTAPWAGSIAKRAHPVALLLGLFATAFTATIVLRLTIWLAVLGARSAF